MKSKLLNIAVLSGLVMTPAMPVMSAQQGHVQAQLARAEQSGADWAEGTVKKVNPDTGKVTISHGPLPNLDMPPMTMVFRVKDPAWLERMKPGDRIRFQVEKQNGALVVTGFQTSP